MAQPLRYQPDYVTKPGEVLEEYLAEAGMTKAELATRCGRPLKTISEIIHGKAAITAETALQFERVLGRPASLWQSLEAGYRLRLAEQQEKPELGRHAAWAKSFPVRELVERGDIEQPASDTDLVAKILRLFGVGTVAGWTARFAAPQLAYRRSPAFKAAPESISAWIRLGEIKAAEIRCSPFDAKKFRDALVKARALTLEPVSEVWDTLVARCASCGVAVVLVPEFKKTHLSGVARWLSKDKALIQLSMRHKRNDHLWFTFFHEAGHLLLHGKKQIFLDADGTDHAELENEANRFAADALIPPAAFERFVAAGDFATASIQRFAHQQRIAPGIVVGRLQRERVIKYSQQNKLTEQLKWNDE